jgi:hypothetical protein
MDDDKELKAYEEETEPEAPKEEKVEEVTVESENIENKENLMVQEISDIPNPDAGNDSDEDSEEKKPLTPQKPNCLMKDDEISDKKSSVKFDESQNVVKEFHKNQKIMNFNPPKKEE